MIDWDSAVLGPLQGVFGQPAEYTPAGGETVPITVVFDEAYLGVDEATGLPVTTARPVAGVQVSQLPAGYDAGNAQGDLLRIVKTGVLYVVKSGKPDGHGHARLDLNVAPA